MPSSVAPLPIIGENNTTADPKTRALLAELQAIVNSLSDIHEAGDLRASARPAAAVGWLLCDGAAVSRSTFAALFAAIGTGYGVGDGTTTFNLPDLRGRVPVGVDGVAARLTASDALGQSSGTEKHTLLVGEIPAKFFYNASGGIPSNAQVAPGSGANDYAVLLDTADWTAGGAGAHNNMQPYQIVNWEIKV